MHRKQLYHQLFILIQSYKRSPNLIYTFKSLYSLTLSNQLTPHSLFYLILYQKLSKKHFHYITNMTKSLQNNSYPGIHEIYNFGICFFGHHYHILNISGLYLEKKSKTFKKLSGFTKWLIWPHPSTSGHEIYNFGRSLIFFGHHYYTLVWCIPGSLFVLFVWGFTSHSRIFHSYGDFTITGEGLHI